VDVARSLEVRFATRHASDWFATLDDAGVPVEIVDETFCRTIFDDPAAHRARLVATTWAGNVGRFEDPGLLVDISPSTATIQRGPCLCGEHTREILVQLGYAEAVIDAMGEDKIVLDAPVPP
jgi:crotonobetainyl-CoA:carnitine CoA-transferase CaiB-like acyl-CoA transferase